jgi:hypothetical protein
MPFWLLHDKKSAFFAAKRMEVKLTGPEEDFLR